MQVSPNIAQTRTALPVETITLDVGGMKCAGCVSVVERQLGQYPGVVAARVNLITEVAVIDYQAGIDLSALAQALTATGFPTKPRVHKTSLEAESDATKRQKETRQQVQQLMIAGFLIMLSTCGHIGHWLGAPMLPIVSNIWFHWGLATLALLGPGRAIIADGGRGLWQQAPNMNTLVGLGTLTAYSTSCVALLFPQLGWECFFDEPVMLLGFILLGRTLEQRARRRATAAFESLLALQPQVARLIGKSTSVTEQVGIEIPVEQVRLGEWLRVLPGEKIPVDGEVILGQTLVDESLMTGEAMPVTKQIGEAVTAGTFNQSGAIIIKATRIGEDTTLAKIVALVEAAQTRKAPVQQLADTVAGYFTYGVLAIATGTFLFWDLAGTKLFPAVLLPMTGAHEHQMMAMVHATSPLLLSLKLAIAVLVIACPCALGLATPTALLVGTSLGAERGLLIKGGDILEIAHAIDTIVFDKTGTLTSGQPILTDCLPQEQFAPLNDLTATERLLQLAATLESGTSHPLATAILHAAQQENLPLLKASNFQTQPGLGISAIVEERLVLLGNQEWLCQHGVTIVDNCQASLAGKTIVYVADDGVLVGVLAVSDRLRPDAIETVRQFKAMNLRVIMLTGDQASAAAAVAQQLEIEESDVIAGVRPEAKAQAIAHLQAMGCCVAMVGDGINDSPALAQADLGIALQAGTDVAVETAGIILMRDRLLDVVESIKLSKATFRKIRQNLFWAFAYNILGIPAAAGVLLPGFGILLNPAAAGALMAFSSVSVVTNSLLLRKH